MPPEIDQELTGNRVVADAACDVMVSSLGASVQESVNHRTRLGMIAEAATTASIDTLLAVTNTTAERQQSIKGAQSTNPQTGQSGGVPILENT